MLRLRNGTGTRMGRGAVAKDTRSSFGLDVAHVLGVG